MKITVTVVDAPAPNSNRSRPEHKLGELALESFSSITDMVTAACMYILITQFLRSRVDDKKFWDNFIPPTWLQLFSMYVRSGLQELQIHGI
jgi:hypothetical protein